MTTIDKIRAKIERRKKVALDDFRKGLITIEALAARRSQLDGLSLFLDTLEEPVSDCHDLEGAAIDFADYARKALYSKDYAISSIADYDHGCIDGSKPEPSGRKPR